MSIWFMHDNHTFTRLDTLPVDAAMDRLEALVDAQGGYGFVDTTGLPENIVIQWRMGEPWRPQVRALLAGDTVSPQQETPLERAFRRGA